MPSRAEPARRTAEWLLRGTALALLAWALVASALGTARGAGGVARDVALDTASADKAKQLAAWARDPELRQLHLALGTAPGPSTRDWLRALRGAGTAVTWSGEIPAVALAADAVADPRGGARVLVAAPAAATVHLADAAGRIDSIRSSAGGGAVRVPAVAGPLRAEAPGASAHIPAPSPRVLRPVIVLGRAGWEAKFVAAALEEQGWQVTTRLQVAPGLAVGPAAPTFDTAQVSAVVALDSSAAGDAAAIARYVRSGGGVILGAEAARLPAFGALVAGRPGALARGAASYAAAVAQVTRETLDAAPIAGLRPDAVPLERRGAGVVVAARRVEAGRAVQLGYEETWRWRMAGGDDAPLAHRRWWTELVSAVAYAPLSDRVLGESAAGQSNEAETSEAAEPAPRAALVSALGMPSARPEGASDRPPFDASRSLPLYIAAALLLCAEWTSRRLRGAK